MAAVAATTTDPDILEAKHERLRVLKLQAAQFGRATPAHITTEIDELEREIAEMRAPPTPALQYLDLRAIVTRHGHILSAIVAGQVITLMLVLLLLSRAVQPAGVAEQPVITPAPAGIARPAITTPIAGAGVPTGGR